MEKGRIVHYIPAFVDRDDPPEEAEYKTLKQLLEVDFVKRMKHDYKSHPGKFHRFSVSWHPEGVPSLMAEYSKGVHFYVVGHLYGNLEIVKQLPKWTLPK